MALGPAIADLVPAAGVARDGLHRDGRRLTRDALAARFRDNGLSDPQLPPTQLPPADGRRCFGNAHLPASMRLMLVKLTLLPADCRKPDGREDVSPDSRLPIS